MLMRIYLCLVGAVSVVLLIRFNMLNEVEQIAFDYFFKSFTDDKYNLFSASRVAKSAAFYKCLAGAFFGGVVGYFTPSLFEKKKKVG